MPDLIRCAGDGLNEAVYLIIPADHPEMFSAVTEVIGQPELQKDERFATPPARARNAAALTEILEARGRSRSKHEVMKALASRGVVCGAVLDTEPCQGRFNELRRFLRALGLNPLEWNQAVAKTRQGSPYGLFHRNAHPGLPRSNPSTREGDVRRWLSRPRTSRRRRRLRRLRSSR